MNTSVHFDPEMFNEPIRTRKKGITLEVALSPYDVPASVNGGYSNEKKKFVIDFNYLGGREKTHSRAVSEHIVLHEGEFSGRVHAIEVDVNELQVDKVQLVVKQRLTEAIKAFSPTEEHTTREGLRSQMNARVLGEVRDHCVERMVGGLEPVAAF